MKTIFTLFLVCLAATLSFTEDAPKIISKVGISKTHMNPTLGDTVAIEVSTGAPGLVTITVIDPDGYAVRSLVKSQTSQPGTHSYQWDGRLDNGEVASPEAYSFKIEVNVAGHVSTYFPADSPVEHLEVETPYYNRAAGVFGYNLTKPARVHLQAGIAEVDEESKVSKGPVLVTVVSREPRMAGPIMEQWNGYSGSIYVPGLPDFMVGIAATALPENSVIVSTGRKSDAFLENARNRKGKSLFKQREKAEHHMGLTRLEDSSPDIQLIPEGAVWHEREKVWKANNSKLKLRYRLEGPGATDFASLPGVLMVFVDKEKMKEISSPKVEGDVEIDLSGLSASKHIVALNWSSRFGPTGVGAIEVTKEK